MSRYILSALLEKLKSGPEIKTSAPMTKQSMGQQLLHNHQLTNLPENCEPFKGPHDDAHIHSPWSRREHWNFKTGIFLEQWKTNIINRYWHLRIQNGDEKKGNTRVILPRLYLAVCIMFRAKQFCCEIYCTHFVVRPEARFVLRFFPASWLSRTCVIMQLVAGFHIPRIKNYLCLKTQSPSLCAGIKSIRK
jgi:hypothetical protein